jgi:hypothetical protein
LIRTSVLRCHGNAYATPLPSDGEEQCISQSNPQLVKSRGEWFHPHMTENELRQVTIVNVCGVRWVRIMLMIKQSTMKLRRTNISV